MRRQHLQLHRYWDKNQLTTKILMKWLSDPSKLLSKFTTLILYDMEDTRKQNRATHALIHNLNMLARLASISMSLDVNSKTCNGMNDGDSVGGSTDRIILLWLPFDWDRRVEELKKIWNLKIILENYFNSFITNKFIQY